MDSEYNKVVKAVGELVMSGIWYSDACQIVFMLMKPSLVQREWDQFESRVNAYTDREIHLNKRKCNLPKYKCIF